MPLLLFENLGQSFVDHLRIVRMVKKVMPEIRVVLGGVHVSALKEKILIQYPEVDCAVVGEGELPLLRLLQGAPFKSIQGLVYRDASGVRFTGLQGRGVELDSLPIDDFNLAKFTPFPGSPIYEKIHELGEFEEDYRKMDCMNFVFVTKGMTRERLDELFLEFYRSHFMRPRVLLGYLTMLWKSPHSWWRFMVNLSSFLRFARSNRRIEGGSR
ncbi:MAG: cobalamin-dependent protein [Desulfurivibrio sp.]|nr:cobalamin-dependent protein [Desulfurivibrio sp.]